MRKSARRAEPRFTDEDDSLAVVAPRSRKDAVALAGAVFAVAAIAVNALFLQSAPHPAPIFFTKPQAQTAPAVAHPRPRPAELDNAKPAAPQPARPRGEIVTDIQKELGRRGFYEGAADGVYGPKTDIALRDFEQASGSKAGSEPSEGMLRTIAQSPAKATRTAATTQPARASDPIGELIVAPPRNVTAVQRVLSEYGYGQLEPNGVMNRQTEAAIEQFERHNKLPVTGQISPRLLRELTALSGRPLE